MTAGRICTLQMVLAEILLMQISWSSVQGYLVITCQKKSNKKRLEKSYLLSGMLISPTICTLISTATLSLTLRKVQALMSHPCQMEQHMQTWIMTEILILLQTISAKRLLFLLIIQFKKTNRSIIIFLVSGLKEIV